MTNSKCVFLKPEVQSSNDRERRDDVYGELIVSAIKEAQMDLVAVDDEQDGVVVGDVTEELVGLVYDADIVIIDANQYTEDDGQTNLSMYLYYLMAFSHSLGNKTILVCEKSEHLKAALHTHHALIYDYQGEGPKGFKKFKKQLKRMVEDIQGGSTRADNPIQAHFNWLNSQKLVEDSARKDAEIERLRRKSKEFAEKQAEVASSKRQFSELTEKIIFKPVPPEPH